ncbi:MAG: pentapeptide repeat-containing protein [Nitrospirales bacterium]|nr:pentapeptide repeat-containing protein [Nitrospirales bacterium]
MPSENLLSLLREGVHAWNSVRNAAKERFRSSHSSSGEADQLLLRPDLTGANLSGLDLGEVDLSDAILDGANIENAYLSGADLTRARLQGVKLYKTYINKAVLYQADLRFADLSLCNFMTTDLRKTQLQHANLFKANLGGAELYRANLTEVSAIQADFLSATMYETALHNAQLTGANLTSTNLSRADLSGADLRYAIVVDAEVSEADFSGCSIYGLSAWNIRGIPRNQSNLLLTTRDDPIITVDDLQIAQFIHLLLNNQNVRSVIDSITSKVVLILGRFTSERKDVLDAIRTELRRLNFTPIIFDFDKPLSKDLTGTVDILARMARFIVADVSDPSSIPHELATVVPHLRTTPIQLIKLQGSATYSMLEDFYGPRGYPWVLKPHMYQTSAGLIQQLAEVIAEADNMASGFRRG